jgi:hypothetical protein
MADPSRLSPNARRAEEPQSEALQRLHRNEISLDEYLDGCVEQALSAWVGKVRPDRLEFVRQMLRDQMRSDPLLIEYIREATGRDVLTESDG